MIAAATAGVTPRPPRFFPVHVAGNWLDADLSNELLDYAIQNEARYQEGSVFLAGEKAVNHTYRKTSVLYDLGNFDAPLRAAALAVKPELEATFGMPSFSAGSVELELAAHSDGAHFDRHVDTFVVHNQGSSKRVFTLVLYLNREPKAFTGGELRMYAIGSSHTKDIEPLHNRLVAFPSIAGHSVQRIDCPSGKFADQRFAVNIWIHR